MTQARLLDLTRSLRRAGGMPTGIDRVERAYLAQFLASAAPCFAIARTAFGYVLLDRDGMADFQRKLLQEEPWSRADLLSRLPRGRDQGLIQAESDFRAAGMVRCSPWKLPKMLAKALPDDIAYFNVGHSNLTNRVLRSLSRQSISIHVLIHDVIPLRFPKFQRARTVEPFRDMLKRTGQFADRVIYNSEATRHEAEEAFASLGRIPPSVVAHLGLAPVDPAHAELPMSKPDRPYFVTVGTIEPRKNHGFLLDLWAEMGASAPPLLICGSRGWNNEAVFSRLDNLPAQSPIQELSNLTDIQTAKLVKNAAGALYPSLAEGFGLPAVEARALGTRVLCNDLPAFKEILDASSVFAPVSDRNLWFNTITSWEKNPPNADTSTGIDGPTWDTHFKTVLTTT